MGNHGKMPLFWNHTTTHGVSPIVRAPNPCERRTKSNVRCPSGHHHQLTTINWVGGGDKTSPLRKPLSSTGSVQLFNTFQNLSASRSAYTCKVRKSTYNKYVGDIVDIQY